MQLMEMCNRAIDQRLALLRQELTVALFEKVEAFFNLVAGVATPLAGVVGALIALVLAIKIDSLSFFFGGIVWLVLLVIFYYVGSKLQHACQKTIDNNPSTIANQEYMDVSALLNLVFAAAALLAGIVAAVKAGSLIAFATGFGIALLFLYVAWLMLQPALVSTYVKTSASAGLDAIAIAILTNKVYLRANKLFFGLLSAIGTAYLLQSLVNVFGDPYEILMGGMRGLLGYFLVLLGLLAPLVCYVLFVFSYMLLDVLRSLLGLGQTATPPEHVAPPAPDGGENPGGSELSGPVAKKIGIALIALVVGLTGVIKGKELYADYQIRAEIRRMEEEKQKAEEAAREEAQKAEQARVAAFAANARKYLNKSSLDLVLDPQVNAAYREIFRADLPVFEDYFAESGVVTEAESLLLAPGCRKSQCDQHKALAVVDLAGARAFAVVMSDGSPRYFGVAETEVPPSVKKWVMGNRR